MPNACGDAVVWQRHLLRAIAALLVAIMLTAATPLAADPRIRAGVIRRARATATHFRPMPEATARLRVPFFRQEHALSCEVAALRMVLAYRGIDVTESDLLAAVGVDPTPRRRSDPRTTGTREFPADWTWGDPDEAFVGDVNGVMGKTGYGVHAGPIGRLAGRYRRAETITSGTAATLTTAIAEGNPVIVWGFSPGRGRLLSWRTLGGKEVHAVDGEHTRVVIGYTGTREEPTGFFAIDPIYGEQYWPVERFLQNWGPFGRTGVIVY